MLAKNAASFKIFNGLRVTKSNGEFCFYLPIDSIWFSWWHWILLNTLYSEGGLRVIDSSVPWQKRKRAEGSSWRFPLLQPGRQTSPLLTYHWPQPTFSVPRKRKINWIWWTKTMALTQLLFRVYMCEGPREYMDHHGIVVIFGYDICFIIKKFFNTIPKVNSLLISCFGFMASVVSTFALKQCYCRTQQLLQFFHSLQQPADF